VLELGQAQHKSASVIQGALRGCAERRVTQAVHKVEPWHSDDAEAMSVPRTPSKRQQRDSKTKTDHLSPEDITSGSSTRVLFGLSLTHSLTPLAV